MPKHGQKSRGRPKKRWRDDLDAFWSNLAGDCIVLKEMGRPLTKSGPENHKKYDGQITCTVQEVNDWRVAKMAYQLIYGLDWHEIFWMVKIIVIWILIFRYKYDFESNMIEHLLMLLHFFT